MSRNTTFGNHTAVNADIKPPTANDVDMVEKRINNALSASPIPR